MDIDRLDSATFALPSLQRAWRDVLDKDLAGGEIAPGIARFKENAEERLTALVEALAERTYTPCDLQAYGDHVQKSAFVLTLDDSTLHEVTRPPRPSSTQTRTPCTSSGSAEPAGPPSTYWDTAFPPTQELFWAVW